MNSSGSRRFSANAFFSDEMSGANVRIAVVGGTREKRLLPLVIVGGAVFQPTAAIGTVEKPGEHTYDARPIWSAAMLAEILNKSKGLPVDDRGVGVGEG